MQRLTFVFGMVVLMTTALVVFLGWDSIANLQPRTVSQAETFEAYPPAYLPVIERNGVELPPSRVHLYQSVIQGDYVYLSGIFLHPEFGAGQVLIVLDISTPTAPVEIGRLDLRYACNGRLWVEGNYAVIGSGHDICLLDISNPQAMRVLGKMQFRLTGYGGIYGRPFSYNDRFYAYWHTAWDEIRCDEYHNCLIFPKSASGTAVFDLTNPPEYPRLPGLEERILGVWNGYLIAHVTENETHWIRLLDASNPDSLTPVGEVSVSMVLPLGVTISGNWLYLYAPFNNEPILILDLASLSVVGRFAAPGGTKNVLIRGNRAFASTGSIPCDDCSRMNTLRVLDISDPANPIELGSFLVEGWGNFSPWEGEFSVVGDHVYTVERDFLRILDTSDAANIREVGRFELPAVGTDAP
jgi:hypothetical protein